MATTAFRKATVRQRAAALAGHYYASDAIFEQETERIFGKHWLCVGRSEQIPNSGDYFLAQVGEESLIILRDPEETARAFFNVCRHRGTPLCTETQGHFVEAIPCPHHGWTYSLTGELQTARQMPQFPRLASNSHSLYACALHEWEGFLWINLASNPAPFAQTFTPLLSRFTPWGMTNLKLGYQVEYDIRANWKLIFQNYSECYHCPPVSAFSGSSSQNGHGALSRGTFLEGYVSLSHAIDRLTMSGNARFSLPGVYGEHLYRVYYYLLFPTLLLSLHPDYVVVHRLFAREAGRTQVICEWLFDPAAIDHPEFDATTAIEQWHWTNQQDWHRCELMQQGIVSHVSPPNTDVNQQRRLSAFDQEYLRVMGA